MVRRSLIAYNERVFGRAQQPARKRVFGSLIAYVRGWYFGVNTYKVVVVNIDEKVVFNRRKLNSLYTKKGFGKA